MSREQSELTASARQVLERQPGVELALLFGSRARGTHGPGSDVDIAVTGSAVDLAQLAAKLSVAVGQEVDVVAVDDDPPIPLLRELIRDAVCLYERSRGAEAAFRARALWAIETDGPMIDAMAKSYIARIANRGTP
jgi:uncharacterized protein